MAITAAGVGSGLDIESIVSQLMVLERRPLMALQQREAERHSELSAYGRVKSAMASFQSAMEALGDVDKFKVFSASSSDNDVLSASASSSASKGEFSVEVNWLAQSHKLASAQVDDADSTTFGGTEGDELRLDIGDSIGGSALVVDLSTAKTLEEIRDAINEADDNPGLTASVLNVDENSQRLVLTAEGTGYENRIQVEFFDGASGSVQADPFGLGLSEANTDNEGNPLGSLEELDASFSVDGFAVTASGNSISSVIDGVSFTLKGPGSATVSVARNTGQISGSVRQLVDAYNDVLSVIRDLQGGDLAGDSSLRGIQNQMRNVLNTQPNGIDSIYGSLSELGVVTERNGDLSFDSSRFSAALDEDFDGVANLLADDDQGYAFRFAALAEEMLSDGGMIDSRMDSLNERIRSLNNQELAWEGRLELKEQSLRSQFAALDSLIGGLQTTSNFLATQLSQLPSSS